MPLPRKSKSMSEEFMTPMGPDVADMAYRQDSEFEMLHRMRVLFRTNDLSCIGKDSLSAKINVNRIT